MAIVLAPEPSSLAAVDDQCASVEAWAEQATSIPELRDANNKLAAIGEYLEADLHGGPSPGRRCTTPDRGADRRAARATCTW